MHEAHTDRLHAARIFAVADAFDAMTNERPYKPAMPVEEALRQIDAGAGSQFDPRIARAFVHLSGTLLPRTAREH